jgi:hypothetical protein
MAKSSVAAIQVQALNLADMPQSNIFYPIGDPLPEACFMLRIINFSTTFLFISYEGAQEGQDIVLEDKHIDIYAQPNALPNGEVAQFPKNLVVSAARPVAGAGFIYVAGYYQKT